MGSELIPESYSLETIERLFRLKNLHRTLAGMYRVKSQDNRRIMALWKDIDKEEVILRADGVEIG